MPTRKNSSPASSKSATKSQPAAKGGAVKSATKTGAMPPYGVAIREAMARGDKQEMLKVAATARKWLKDVQAALDQLDKAGK